MHHPAISTTPSGVRWLELFDQGGIRMDRADYPAGLKQPRHDHGFMTVTVILAGSLRERVGSREAAGDALSITVREPGVEHACDWDSGGTRTLSLDLECSALAQTAPGFSTPRPWMLIRREQTVRAMLRLFTGTRGGHLPSKSADLVLEVLAAIEPDEPERVAAPPAWVKRARDAFRDMIRRRPTTRELAADAGVTPVHFARVFRRYVGCSPTEYARQVRLATAVETLALERDGEIGRLPYRSGFYDHSHMCRELRRSLDATPSLIRALATPVPAGPSLRSDGFRHARRV